MKTCEEVEVLFHAFLNSKRDVCSPAHTRRFTYVEITGMPIGCWAQEVGEVENIVPGGN
jgi:hypothetical protein